MYYFQIETRIAMTTIGEMFVRCEFADVKVLKLGFIDLVH
jgi:hypothetical protein